ncbi:hypothetical protein FVE85_3605 [Porphyridium purpureum]|uniref:Uncharacterized protein n=1 Tax=Porphyridium purpureum TaxID=35688 RepID=A0A5J4YP37_PORPP|nr:hypothetical protein FVE85_3605 [Porphyridium purpureum]|eukprot:POR4496..scf249_10
MFRRLAAVALTRPAPQRLACTLPPGWVLDEKERRMKFKPDYQSIADVPLWPARSEKDKLKSGGFDDPLQGPFFAIRKGLDGFRGVVAKKDVCESLTRHVPSADMKMTQTLRQAMDYVQSFLKRATPNFFAFRYGIDGARGFTTDRYVYLDLVERIEQPHCDAEFFEKYQFNNMTQALLFCEQAGTEKKHWQTLEHSIRYFAKHSSLDIVNMMDRYLVRAGEDDLNYGPVKPPGSTLFLDEFKAEMRAEAEAAEQEMLSKLPPLPDLNAAFEELSQVMNASDASDEERERKLDSFLVTYVRTASRKVLMKSLEDLDQLAVHAWARKVIEEDEKYQKMTENAEKEDEQVTQEINALSELFGAPQEFIEELGDDAPEKNPENYAIEQSRVIAALEESEVAKKGQTRKEPIEIVVTGLLHPR